MFELTRKVPHHFSESLKIVKLKVYEIVAMILFE